MNAQESLNLVGTDPRPGSLVRSGLFNSVIGVGDGGEVNVFTDRLTVGDGATLTSSSFGLGNSGNVNVNATTSIFLEGPLVVTGANSSIGSIAAFTGNAGQVNLSTQQLTLLNNSTIASTTLGSGRGGDITVNAREAIDIIGIGDPGFSASGIIATTLNLGDSGNILLNTSQLTLGNRGLILSSTLASGKGGSITLNADRITANDASEIDSSSLFLNPVSQAELGITVSPEGNAGDIQITAQRLTLENRSFITTGTEASGSAGRMTLNIDEINILRESFIASSSTIPDPIFQEQFGILVPTGEARDITITGNRLRLDDRASISVNNEGEAPAGVIDITTGSLALNNQSTISATNASGEEGDIRLRARELLLLQNDSQITTEASGTGNGGDIAITAGFLLAARNGDIIANAFGGDGGNINITADGILGTAVRDNLTPASDIVASSQAGSSGTITLTDPQVDVNAGLVALPSQPADPATQIANRCAAVEGSSFTVTGRGGLPENPTALLRGQTLWHGESAGVQPSRTQISQVIQEATEWRVNGAGQVVLAAALPHSPTLFHSKAGNRQFPDELNDRGYQWFVQGKIGVAIQTWQEAEKAYRQGGNQTGEWGSRLNQAQGLQRLGQYRRAHSLLQKVAIEMETQPSNLLKAKVLRSLGSTLQAIGNPVQAKTLLEESWRISSGLNAPAETAATLFSIGNVLQDLSQPNDAITYYTRTIDLSPDPLLQVQASLNYLSLLIEAQRWEQIHELIPAIQTQFTELSSSQATSQTAIYARLNFADRLLQVEQHDRLNPDLTLADDQLTIALRHSRHLEDTRSEAYTLGQLGQYYMQQQQWQPALQVTQQSLQIAQEINAIDIVAIVAPQLGEILKHQGELEQGTIAYQLAFEALQTLRTDLVAISPDVQFSLRDTVEPIYREFVSLLLSNPTQENLEQARRAIEALQLSELDNFFGDACLNAQPVQIDAIDTQAAVLYPIILDDRLEVILSLPNQPLRQYTTPLSRSEIEYSINLLRRHLDPASSGAEQLQFAQQLYDWLIRPEEAELKQANITTLVFVSDGNLRNVPMAALHDGKEYLIENYAIALSPGLQLFPRNATRQRAGLLVAGVTEEIAGFAPLPGVEREIAAITTDIEASVLLNQQFTRQTFKTTLEETAFPIVHLATHGQFSSDPKETFLGMRIQ